MFLNYIKLDDGRIFRLKNSEMNGRVTVLSIDALCSVANSRLSCKKRAQFGMLAFPTGPLSNLEPQDKEIGEMFAVQKRLATDFEAP